MRINRQNTDVLPVTNRPIGLARYTAAAATSSGSPTNHNGVIGTYEPWPRPGRVNSDGGRVATSCPPGEMIESGAIVLTRIPRSPSSSASDMVRFSSAAFIAP